MSPQLSTLPTTLPTSRRPVQAPSATRPAAPAAGPALEGIERLMAEALGAPGAAAADDPGAIEYDSWLRRLRRVSP